MLQWVVEVLRRGRGFELEKCYGGSTTLHTQLPSHPLGTPYFGEVSDKTDVEFHLLPEL